MCQGKIGQKELTIGITESSRGSRIRIMRMLIKVPKSLTIKPSSPTKTSTTPSNSYQTPTPPTNSKKTSKNWSINLKMRLMRQSGRKTRRWKSWLRMRLRWKTSCKSRKKRLPRKSLINREFTMKH